MCIRDRSFEVNGASGRPLPASMQLLPKPRPLKPRMLTQLARKTLEADVYKPTYPRYPVAFSTEPKSHFSEKAPSASNNQAEASSKNRAMVLKREFPSHYPEGVPKQHFLSNASDANALQQICTQGAVFKQKCQVHFLLWSEVCKEQCATVKDVDGRAVSYTHLTLPTICSV